MKSGIRKTASRLDLQNQENNRSLGEKEKTTPSTWEYLKLTQS